MEKKKEGSFKFLDTVERIGNKLPHPIAMFGILAIVTVLLSWVLSTMGVSVVGEVMNKEGMLEEKTFTVVNLLSRSGIAWMLTNVVSNFTSYAPLGTVLIAMVGIGMADGSGYITALLKKALASTPPKLIAPMLVFLGVMANVSSDAGYVIVVPIGMMIMHSVGRHPLAGFAATMAGVSGGYSANLIVTSIDPQLAALSTEAAAIVDPNYVVNPTANWWFMIVSTLLLAVVGTLVTERIIEPRLGKYEGEATADAGMADLSETESRALKSANIALLLTVVFVVACAIPQNSFLRNEKTGSLLMGSPLMNGVTPLISIAFFIVGVVYGKKAGLFHNHRDVCKEMGKTMSSMGSYLALAVVASQFIKYFNYTNIGNLISIAGADFLSKMNVNPILLILCFILFCAFMNLLMASATAKWTLLAPIFVPMFMKLGLSPELTQAAYRVADSSTNIISPVMAYLAVMITFAQRYEKNAGIGTVWSLMLPYCIGFIVSWAVLLIIWMLGGWELGPAALPFLAG
ncbi:MAG: AbgT family transporter [Lachnospiraceae bacterium]|nr:AbgT family transporter [Lachnospiraceae bacterium]